MASTASGRDLNRTSPVEIVQGSGAVRRYALRRFGCATGRRGPGVAEVDELEEAAHGEEEGEERVHTSGFRSTRLIRELLEAEARMPFDAGATSRIERLLDVFCDHLPIGAIALVDPAGERARGVRGHQRAVMAALLDGDPEGERLRALARAGRKADFAAHAGIGSDAGDWPAGFALVALRDGREIRGLLAIDGGDNGPGETLLRSLAPAFHLLAILLRPTSPPVYAGQAPSAVRYSPDPSPGAGVGANGGVSGIHADRTSDEGPGERSGSASSSADNDLASEGAPEAPFTAPWRSGPCTHLWTLDEDPSARRRLEPIAQAHGANFCQGSPAPSGPRPLLLVDLFAECADRAVTLALADERIGTLVYACDDETGRGFELGPIGWIDPALDPLGLLSCIEEPSMGAGGVLIVSPLLRELGMLRTALVGAGVTSSFACDGRQAVELLEIVGRPSAILIDFDLADGEALSLACRLRRDPKTRSLRIFFLLRGRIDIAGLRSHARRADYASPYGWPDVDRLVGAALSSWNAVQPASRTVD